MALKVKTKPGATAPAHKFKRSKLEVFDVPVDLLVDSENNPNEQDEATFDRLPEGVRAEGVDEPPIIVPFKDGKYKIISGHHRVKAARAAGIKLIPCVIKDTWDEDRQKMEIVNRNNLRGAIDPARFTLLYNELKA